MSDQTPTESGTFSTSFVRQMIGVADRFRAAWVAGDRPAIEDYLGAYQGRQRLELLREMLEMEVGFLVEGGETPDRMAYRVRFADDEALVDSVWAEAGLVPLSGDFRFGSPSDDPTIDLPSCPDATTFDPEPTTHRDRRPEFEVEVFPRWLGRYRLDEIRGEGGFGRVYRGFDGDLNRWVAIKVPHPRRVAQDCDVEDYLAEARIVAGLDHLGIVPVYDFGRTEDGRGFIVSKFIEGGDLSKSLRRERPTILKTVTLLSAIADAVEYAHRHGLVHRDIKPRNLLLDPDERPYLADFGAALLEENFGKGPTFAGTPYYMSPEQARGEGHLVDGSSDLFSLGVVLYEMLTGVRPFKGANWRETIEQIKTMEPCPPRQIDESIPPELERICLKALSKKVSDRHPSAAALAEDLRLFLTGTPVEMTDALAVTALVPKGLRSFEAADSEAFLRLLPGTRDRNGLPELLAFWIGRISEADEDDPMRVGLVYGPSGCGKTSFVKAGLLPRLPSTVHSVLIEATPGKTEVRLAGAIRRRVPDLPPDADLTQLLAMIRWGQGLPQGHQLLIVLDQFEQRLHAEDDTDVSELAVALRQCDGKRIRCLLIVRDDFWMSVTRFLSELEVPLIGRKNGAAIDLFDRKHARIVLEEFGRAYGALPDQPAALSTDQSAFLDGAIAGLTREGKIIPVQLSLFAEMVKGKAWTPVSLEALGGAEGVGVAFLEETFRVETAPIEHRQHYQAARSVLEALLPGPGADLKGSTRSRSELRLVSGYEGQPDDFEALERLLDQELRLITPVDPVGATDEPGYQLTHDYLVPSLREWLGRKLRETSRGRARQRLAERSSLWNARHERKQLPSLSEWMRIRLLTRSSGWNPREAAMMRAGDRFYAAGLLASLATIGLWLALIFVGYCRLQSRALLDRLASAEPAELPGIVEQMGSYRFWGDSPLRDALARAAPGSRMALRARLALLPVDPDQAVPLAAQMLDSDPADVRVILPALKPHSPALIDRYWRILNDGEALRGRRLRASCGLAAFAADDPRWPSVAADVVATLTAEDMFSLVHWSDLLRPVRVSLLPPLKAAYLTHRTDHEGDIAATLLGQFAADRVTLIRELVLDSEPRQLGVLVTTLKAQGDPAIQPIVEALMKIVEDDSEGEPPSGRDALTWAAEGWRDRKAMGRANAAMALVALGRPSSSWPMLKAGANPRARTYFILRMGRSGIDPMEAIRRLRVESEGSIRQAVILGLVDYPDNLLPPARREGLAREFLALYRDDPDPGVHVALERLLDRWKMCDRVRAEAEAIPRGKPDAGRKRWYLNIEGETMVVVPRPTEFLMGSPDQEPNHKIEEVRHLRRIDRSFAMGSKEVTVRQFLRAFPNHDYDTGVAPTEDCPINRITWFHAARYCRWLSDREKIAEDQMCYPRIEDIKPGMRMIPNYLKRTGYRLPTEAEWEASARAGSLTTRFYGYDNSPEMMSNHSWNVFNSQNVSHAVGRTIPNAFGLFDVLGNAYDRCHDAEAGYTISDPGPTLDTAIPDEIIDSSSRRVIRGGAYHRNTELLRMAARHFTGGDDPNQRVGFRVARTVP